MKKILIYLMLCACVASCNNTAEKKINVSQVPIKTKVLDIEIGQKIDIDCSYNGWLKPMFLSGGFVFTPSFEQISLNITQYECWPKITEHFYYGGVKWNYLSIGTFKSNIVYYIALIGSYKTIDDAKLQYDIIIKKLTEIYGDPNFGEYGAMWTDMVNYIILNHYNAESRGGEIRGYCELRYRNIKLEEEVNQELNSEF